MIHPKSICADVLGRLIGVIEILSKYTSAKDLNIKFDVYESAGVKEYWVVHPSEQTLLIYTLGSVGKYEGSLKPYVRTDKVSPKIFPDLQISLEDVFFEYSE